jgi:hypothetical protein
MRINRFSVKPPQGIGCDGEISSPLFVTFIAGLGGGFENSSHDWTALAADGAVVLSLS